nr:MAG TPA: hypothetical protein [Caudoviricetes sp.]DAV33103.1 MAG TPA: hypothetical protein [Caudoviricetes sp.]
MIFFVFLPSLKRPFFTMSAFKMKVKAEVKRWN